MTDLEPLMRAALALLALSSLTACTQVAGTIDGDEVPGMSSFYVESEDSFGGDGLLIVYLAQLDEPCLTYADFLDDFDDADSPEERAEAWEENLPEEFWELQLWLRVDDTDDELGGQELEGVAWDRGLEDDDEAAMLGRRYTDHPSEGSFAWWGVFSGDSSDWFDSYRSDDGGVLVQSHSPGESIRGRFDTHMVDDDGDDEGTVTVRFNAQRCEEAERYIFD